MSSAQRFCILTYTNTLIEAAYVLYILLRVQYTGYWYEHSILCTVPGTMLTHMPICPYDIQYDRVRFTFYQHCGEILWYCVLLVLEFLHTVRRVRNTELCIRRTHDRIMNRICNLYDMVQVAVQVLGVTCMTYSYCIAHHVRACAWRLGVSYGCYVL